VESCHARGLGRDAVECSRTGGGGAFAGATVGRRLPVGRRQLRFGSVGGSGLRAGLSVGSAAACQCRQGAPLPESASAAESGLVGRGIWQGVVRTAGQHRAFVWQCDVVCCGAGSVAGLGETTASGSYLGVGETLDQRCPNREKTRTYVLNEKGSGALGWLGSRILSDFVKKITNLRLTFLSRV